eukprot:symbB.v1.2.002102.t1/scaffold114.1/size323002/8
MTKSRDQRHQEHPRKELETLKASQRSASLPTLHRSRTTSEVGSVHQRMVFDAPGQSTSTRDMRIAQQGYIAGPRAKWGPVARILAK